MRERIIYECEHCNRKKLINKTQMKKHEDICWFNLKNKTCVTCDHYEYEPGYRYCYLKQEQLENKPIVECKDWREKEEV